MAPLMKQAGREPQFDFEDCTAQISVAELARLTTMNLGDDVSFDATIIKADSLLDVSVIMHNQPNVLIRSDLQQVWVKLSGCNPTLIQQGRTVTFTGKISKQEPILAI